MITITNTITIAITIAIAIAVAIAIISISLRPTAHTYGHNQWEVDTRFRSKIWIGDLLSPSSTCLPFLRNLRLQLSAPLPWSIMWSRLSGCSKDKVETMISTDISIWALYAPRHWQHTTWHMLPVKHYPPYAPCLMPPAAWLLLLMPAAAWRPQLALWWNGRARRQWSHHQQSAWPPVTFRRYHVRLSCSGWRSVGRGWDDMIRPGCEDPRNLRMS